MLKRLKSAVFGPKLATDPSVRLIQRESVAKKNSPRIRNGQGQGQGQGRGQSSRRQTREKRRIGGGELKTFQSKSLESNPSSKSEEQEEEEEDEEDEGEGDIVRLMIPHHLDSLDSEPCSSSRTSYCSSLLVSDTTASDLSFSNSWKEEEEEEEEEVLVKRKASVTGIFEIKLFRRHRGMKLGFTVVGGSDSSQGPIGIYVRRIHDKGMAAEDGRLHEGDRILRVNSQSLTDSTHEEAVRAIRRATKTPIKLIIFRHILWTSTPKTQTTHSLSSGEDRRKEEANAKRHRVEEEDNDLCQSNEGRTLTSDIPESSQGQMQELRCSERSDGGSTQRSEEVFRADSLHHQHPLSRSQDKEVQTKNEEEKEDDEIPNDDSSPYYLRSSRRNSRAPPSDDVIRCRTFGENEATERMLSRDSLTSSDVNLVTNDYYSTASPSPRLFPMTEFQITI